MSLRSGLVEILIGAPGLEAVGPRVHLNRSPQPSQLPHIVIQVDLAPWESLGGRTKQGDAEVRVDCKSASSVEAEALADAVDDFLGDYVGPMGSQPVSILATLDRGQVDTHEDPIDASDVGRAVTSTSFTVQYSRA